MSDAEFEYIVIGSGAGGGPLAANLAQAGFKVLLMEAGGDPCSEDVRGADLPWLVNRVQRMPMGLLRTPLCRRC